MMLQACLNLLACRKSFAMLLSNIFSWANAFVCVISTLQLIVQLMFRVVDGI